ncbi:RT0821/Lpp0805 family surface protein [Aestuariispira ectoiniformans]|uniref:RT0821/Lpp0805 family surface protein n=1 Tax=Aestuariispira ectoiniformans TaxID=2775080 RepID=UPI00223B1625|nr:RT0821/Lpp0805 family surface protein [Aestuariispira ectoiniformans]
MKKLPAIALTVTLGFAVPLAGCTSDYGPKQTVGGLSGAVLGGLLGAQFGSGSGQLAMTGIGVLVGSLMGSNIGKSMDELDRIKADQATHKAHVADIGETITWNNPESGHYGSITPTRDGVATNGQYCREYRQTIHVGDDMADGYGIACQQPDGSWKLVSQSQ